MIVCRGKRLRFHQIQYRLFDKTKKIGSFTPLLTAAGKKELEKIKAFYQAPYSPTGYTEKRLVNAVIKNATPVSLFNLAKGGRVVGIEIVSTDLKAIGSNDIRLRAFWDGEKIPAIDCPLAAFFGFGIDHLPAMKGLLAGTDNNKLYCYFPMPFDRSARIELYSNGTVSIPVRATVFYSLQPRKQNQEAKFYTAWEKELTKQGEKHVFLDIHGKGQYIGTVLLARGIGTDGTPFFEGDDSTATDGLRRMNGTGSEDYFNGGWYDITGRWDAVHAMPLSGCIGYSKDLTITGGYRFFINDKISFNKSIYHAIEHGPELGGVKAEYESVSYYYSDQLKITNK